MKSVIKMSILGLALTFSATGHTEQETMHGHAPMTTDNVSLSPKLKKILAQEMKALDKGMKSLVPAIISGDWHQMEEIGTKMHDSYIMSQKLTVAQIEELHRTLPVPFKELDHSFHHSAGMLAHAASKRNRELVSFYFYKVSEACASCHARYATDKFPGFARQNEHDEHH